MLWCLQPLAPDLCACASPLDPQANAALGREEDMVRNLESVLADDKVQRAAIISQLEAQLAILQKAVDDKEVQLQASKAKVEDLQSQVTKLQAEVFVHTPKDIGDQLEEDQRG